MDLLRTMGSEVIVVNTNEPFDSPNFIFAIQKRLLETIPNSLIPDQVNITCIIWFLSNLIRLIKFSTIHSVTATWFFSFTCNLEFIVHERFESRGALWHYSRGGIGWLWWEIGYVCCWNGNWRNIDRVRSQIEAEITEHNCMANKEIKPFKILKYKYLLNPNITIYVYPNMQVAKLPAALTLLSALYSPPTPPPKEIEGTPPKPGGTPVLISLM